LILGVIPPVPASQYHSVNINLSQFDDGRTVLSFNSVYENRYSYFRVSDDNGEIWNDEVKSVPALPTTFISYLSINSIDASDLIAIYELTFTDGNGRIYKSISSDDGISWNETEQVIDESLVNPRPRISKHVSGSMSLIYQTKNPTSVDDYIQYDIYWTETNDGGSNWTQVNRFTEYVGDDYLVNITPYNELNFISFSSSRFSAYSQIVYSILTETVEVIKPPKIIDSGISFGGIIFENKEFIYQARVIDDDSVSNVKLNIEDPILQFELFDDGLHNDEGANDHIFGNNIPFIYPHISNDFVLDVNNITLPINNKGIIAAANVTTLFNTGLIASDNNFNEGMMDTTLRLWYGGSGGKFDDEVFLFSAGFYMSGYNGDELWANGIASSALVQDYQPGKVGSVPEDPLNTIYIVYNTDPPFGTSWIKWGDAVGLGAEFYDGDGDGIYNPVDKNWNGTWDLNEDMPLLIGDVTAWCVYNDGVPDTQRRFDEDPLGIEIEQTVFASSLPNLENVIFYRYKITNTSSFNSNLDSVFFCPWDDTDMGQVDDDLGASDTLISYVFTYNDAYDQLYGYNPPAIFTTVLQGPVVKSSNITDTAYINRGQLLGQQLLAGSKNLDLFSFAGYAKSDPNQSEPRDKYHVRNYIYGRDRFRRQLNPCETLYGIFYGENCDAANPIFWFSGDPVTQTGWLDNLARDDRKFTSIGPFNLEKDKPVEIITALTVGRGTDHLNSITVARNLVRGVIEEYKINFVSV